MSSKGDNNNSNNGRSVSSDNSRSVSSIKTKSSMKSNKSKGTISKRIVFGNDASYTQFNSNKSITNSPLLRPSTVKISNVQKPLTRKVIVASKAAVATTASPPTGPITSYVDGYYKIAPLILIFIICIIGLVAPPLAACVVSWGDLLPTFGMKDRIVVLG